MEKIDRLNVWCDLNLGDAQIKINELVDAHNEMVERFEDANKELDKAEKDMCTSKALSNIKFPSIKKLGGIKKKKGKK